MTRILHISDLHLGPMYVAAAGEAALSSAEALAPDLIVVSGDLTQRAKPDEFEEASRFLARLPAVPRVVVPGNHDIALYRVLERMFFPYRHYQSHIAKELEFSLRVEGLELAALNTTAPLRAIKNGRLVERHLKLLRRTFGSAKPSGVVRVLVAHHHFAPAPDYEHTDVMPRAREFLDELARLEVDLILGGHLHRAYVGNSLDVYAGADPERGIVIIQCGTTTSRRGRAREREKNSLNLVEISGDEIEVTHFLYYDSDRAFLPSSRHVFPRFGRRLLRR